MSTLATAQTDLTTWQAAKNAIAKGQTVSIAGRTITRADLSEVNAMITDAARRVKRYTAVASGSKNPGVMLPGFK